MKRLTKQSTNTGDVPVIKSVVVVVGDSQSGKSTFIQYLHKLANKPIPKELQVGEGGKAMTRETTVYDLTIDRKPLKMYEDSSKKVSVDIRGVLNDYRNLNSLSNDSQMYLEYEDAPTCTYQLKIIDTPGLNGTDKEDEENMRNLLLKIIEIGYFNALMVLNKGSNYGPQFQNTLNYYYKMFGKPAIDVFHTKYTVDDLITDLENNRNFPDIPRVTEFKDVFKDINADHYRIDSVPHTTYRKRPMREFLATDTMYEWLLSLQGAAEYSTKNMQYEKTPIMIALDKQVAGMNLGIIEGHRKEMTLQNENISQLLKDIETMKLTLNDKNAARDVAQSYLDSHNNDELVISQKESSRVDWRFFSKARFAYKMTSDYLIKKAEKLIDGDTNCYFDEQSEKIEKVTEFDEVRYRYHINVNGYIWGSCYTTVILWCSNADKFAKDIVEYKAKLEENQKEIIKLEVQKKELEAKNAHSSEEVNRLAKLIDDYASSNGYMTIQKVELAFMTKEVMDIYKEYKELVDKNQNGDIQIRELAKKLNKVYLEYSNLTKA